MDRDAPERIALPSGSSRPVDYAATGAPALEGRVQEFYGLAEPTPSTTGRTIPPPRSRAARGSSASNVTVRRVRIVQEKRNGLAVELTLEHYRVPVGVPGRKLSEYGNPDLQAVKASHVNAFEERHPAALRAGPDADHPGYHQD